MPPVEFNRFYRYDELTDVLQAWASEHLDLASPAEELHRVGEEVGRLRDLLRQQGTGPQDGAA